MSEHRNADQDTTTRAERANPDPLRVSTPVWEAARSKRTEASVRREREAKLLKTQRQTADLVAMLMLGRDL